MNKTVYDIDRFVKDLDKYLKDNNITQAHFARIMDFSEAKVSRLLNGTRPKLHVLDLYRIAKYIGVSVDSYRVGDGYVVDVDSYNIHDMSIEEIDKMIEKLRSIRREKIDAEWAKLNEEQERLLKLKAMED